MKICLLSAEYPPMQGGVGDYTRELARALIQLGHSVTVLTSAPDQQSDSAPASGGEPRLQRVVQRWNWGCWPVVHSVVRQLSPDILHIQYQTAAYGMHPAINLTPAVLRLAGQQSRIAGLENVKRYFDRLARINEKLSWTSVLGVGNRQVGTRGTHADRH